MEHKETGGKKMIVQILGYGIGFSIWMTGTAIYGMVKKNYREAATFSLIATGALLAVLIVITVV